jgi:hypothetical protein
MIISKKPPSKKVALNCTHLVPDGRKIGMMEKWKEIHINCCAIFQYSNIPITSLMYNKKTHNHHQRRWISNSN